MCSESSDFGVLVPVEFVHTVCTGSHNLASAIADSSGTVTTQTHHHTVQGTTATMAYNDANSNDGPIIVMPMPPYRCIHCLQPCHSLYRTIGSSGGAAAADIKLSQCASCGENVDPYCEREWLLVVLDLVLLRQAAYRHVLCNRFVAQWMEEEDKAMLIIKETASGAEKEQASRRANNSLMGYYNNYLYFILAGSSILRAHIGMISTQDRVDADHTVEAASSFVKLAAVSLAGNGVQIIVTAACLRMMLVLFTTVAPKTAATAACDFTICDDIFSSTVALALLLPAMAGHVATASVHLWENSEAVRLLGSVLVLLHQWVALTTATEAKILDQQQQQQGQQSSTRTVAIVKTAIAFAAALLGRAAVMAIFWRVFTTTTSMPCPGLRWNITAVFGTDGYVCFA